MTAQTGRTVQDFTKLLISYDGNMVDMMIDSLGDLGFDYKETDMTSWSDKVHGYLVGKPDFQLTWGGPIDNTPDIGSSTILRQLAGSMIALSFDVQVGVRHDWEEGEQEFGVSADIDSNSGLFVTTYKESGGKYKASARMLPGSIAAPAWGVAAQVVPS